MRRGGGYGFDVGGAQIWECDRYGFCDRLCVVSSLKVRGLGVLRVYIGGDMETPNRDVQEPFLGVRGCGDDNLARPVLL
jgi:hypothetical protein